LYLYLNKDIREES